MKPIIIKLIVAAIFGISAFLVFHYLRAYVEVIFIVAAAALGYFVAKNNIRLTEKV